MSRYVSQTLMQGEKVAVSFNPHKIIIAGPVILFLMALIFSVYGKVWFPDLNFIIFRSYTLAGIITFVLIVYSGFKLVNRIVEYRTSEYTVTNLRVVMKTGVLDRVAVELMMNRLEAVTVQQNLFGQMFNYGVVILVGVGGSRDIFNYVPKPMYFRQQVQFHRSNEPIY
jgi:uncharacterized membrane protein YdbT with pleckstrin-like domain